MRNLKRALSLALAFVMVMSLMIVGTSAKTFTDAEDISNVEAVTIVDGLSVMNGYPDGSFKPEGIVTRAEMAVVISKMLYGPNFNPANFVGAEAFTDTPAWAEGYINLCASLGIIAGRGNGIFDPDATVTTSEASAMFLRALGYLQTEAEFGNDWQLAVTSKATNLGLYGDLELSINAGLSRENVAVMAFNTLFAQRVAYDDYRGLYVKANDRNVVVTNGTDDEMNTLAQNTFGLYIAEGVVVANGQTDKKLSASLKSDAQTTVMFTEPADLNKDGKNEYAEGDTYDFEVETGLDMIGHAASVYYKIVNKTPEVYVIVDEATLVDYITYNSNNTKLADAANDAGFKKNSVLDVAEKDYIVNYDFDTPYSKLGKDKLALDTLLLISNSGNKQVDYVIALDQYLDKIDLIDDDDEDNIDYEFVTTDVDDMYVPLNDVAEGDYVIVTDIGNQGKVAAFQTAEIKTADITKIIGKSTNNSVVTGIIADGTEYSASEVDSNAAEYDFGGALNLVTDFTDIDVIGEANLIMDQFGNVIGLAGEKSVPNYAYVAEYGVRHSTGSLNTTNVLTAHVYFADGTDGVYEVDLAKSNALAVDVDDKYVKEIMNGTGDDRYVANGAARGLYNVHVMANDKVDIDVITTDVSSDVFADNNKLIKAHSTILNGNENVTTDSFDKKDVTLYNNNDTVYFYITGSYVDDSLRVNVITGIKNVLGFTNATAEGDDDPTIECNKENNAGKGMKEAYATAIKSGNVITNRAAIDVMLVQGVRTEGTDVYYYNQGNYEVVKAEGGYTVTYIIYDNETGEKTSVTYDNDGKYFETVNQAKDWADEKENGFYTLGATNLKEYFTKESDNYGTANDGLGVVEDITYVVDDNAMYDEYAENLFSELVKVGSITDDTVIVDVCNSGLTSITKIARAIKDGTGKVLISYSFGSDYDTEVLYVTYYDPDTTVNPGNPQNDTYALSVNVTAAEDSTGKSLVTGTLINKKTEKTVVGEKISYTYTVELLNAQGTWTTAMSGSGTDTTGDSGEFKFDVDFNTQASASSYRFTVIATNSVLGSVTGVQVGG